MAGRIVPERFFDAGEEPDQTLTPIRGYEKVPLVSLKEAIQPIKSLLGNADSMVETAKRNSRKPADGLTSDESAAIHLYTMEWDEPPSLYNILNQKLRSKNRNTLTPWFLFLKLFFTALYKLPSFKGTIWRGVRGNLTDQYDKDQIWWGTSSCTETMKIMEKFIGKEGVRTIFNIECINGKTIRAHSYFNEENEILLMPGTFLQVVDTWSPAKGLYIIHLREATPPYETIASPFDLSSFEKLTITPEEKKKISNNNNASAESYVKPPSHTNHAVPQSSALSSVTIGASDEIRLILLGITGSGKSSFGNSILGANIFEAKRSSVSVTKHCCIGSRSFHGKKILVVDTPGFIDPNATQEALASEIVRAYQKTLPGPHAFLFVINAGARYGEINLIKDVVNIFGSDAVNYTIIVFTHSDSFLEEGITTEQFLAELNPNNPLYGLLRQCDGRYITVNNRGTQSEKDATLEELLCMISKLIAKNNSHIYQTHTFVEIAEVIAQAKSSGSYQSFKPSGTFN